MEAGAATRRLRTPQIVFLVVAAAAPLAALIGTVPLAFAIGDGAGVPGMFALVGLVLLCFSVGYAAMSRRIVNTGGFYTYLVHGLGRPPAVGGALVAVVSYNAIVVGMVGAFGYFAALVLDQAGLSLPWQLYSALGMAAVAVLGYRKIDLSARVLSVLIVAEVAILLLLDVGVLGHKGAAALPLTSFAPHTVFSGSVGAAMMFAFVSFIGFESAALYGEETHDPRRSVPLATYCSVLVITVFYAFTSWVVVGALGAGNVGEQASRQLGNLFFTVDEANVGTLAAQIMALLLCTSLFASLVALHNAASRYMFALGRDAVLPGWLGHRHPRHASPHRASLVQTAVNVVVIAAFAVAGLDPYLNLATSMLGVGALGVVVLQAAAAAAIIGFFRRRADGHWWRTRLAPLLGLVGLAAAAVLVVHNFRTLVGTDNPVVTSLPWVLLVVALAGTGYGLRMRATRPAQYAALAGASAAAVTDTAQAPGPRPEAVAAAGT
jgi:amino acid transporter